MPIKYALRKPIPFTEEQEADHVKLGYQRWPRTFSYEEEVPPIVAEMDEENGLYAIFSVNDVRLSDWLVLKTSEALQKEQALGSAKPGPTLKDSIRQDINAGDYILTHNYSQDGLELNLVLRNMNVKTVAQQLTNERSWGDAVRKRNPEATLRIPKEFIEGGSATSGVWEKRHALCETQNIPNEPYLATYIPADELTAANKENGYYAYFNNGELVSGWISHALTYWDARLETDDTFKRKKAVDALDEPVTDALGAELYKDDWVFSNDNYYNTFMLCQITGFTDERVRLLGYAKYRNDGVDGHRLLTWNSSKKIVKLPIDIS